MATDIIMDPKGEPEVIELTRPQSIMARRMAETKSTVPHFYLTAEVDMTSAVASRVRQKARTSDEAVRFSITDLIVKACAVALRQHPRINASYRDGKLYQYPRVNVGIAVAHDHVVIVPVIRDADSKTVTEIAERSTELAGRVLTRAITPSELTGGTFTVSNLGMYGIDSVIPVINSPEAAILGVGRIRKEPRIGATGEIEARSIMSLTLSCDHRAVSGADAAQFLETIRRQLQQPDGLIEP
jgi:pyruvate dehydrogenase E2 component (dihydrolipoamide acetyltransferase)